MNYLYHIVPSNMKGNYLMPLNELKKVYPKIYKEEVKKYERRKHLLKERIKPFNCLWNDVLFLVSVSPKKLKKALKEAGKKEFTKTKWFKINPKQLEKVKTIIYLSKAILYLYKSNKISEKNDLKQFRKFDPRKLNQYNYIPKETKKYYKEEIENGRKPLLFSFIPHILYKGNINVKKIKMVKW